MFRSFGYNCSLNVYITEPIGNRACTLSASLCLVCQDTHGVLIICTHGQHYAYAITKRSVMLMSGSHTTTNINFGFQNNVIKIRFSQTSFLRFPVIGIIHG